MTENLEKIIVDALEDLKGLDIKSLDVTGMSDVMDRMIIVTGNSNRHVKSLANNVVDESKAKGFRPIGIEGGEVGEWVLVDYGDTVVHVMQQATRDFYDLEKLWSHEPATRKKSDD